MEETPQVVTSEAPPPERAMYFYGADVMELIVAAKLPMIPISAELVLDDQENPAVLVKYYDAPAEVPPPPKKRGRPKKEQVESPATPPMPAEVLPVVPEPEPSADDVAAPTAAEAELEAALALEAPKSDGRKYVEADALNIFKDVGAAEGAKYARHKANENGTDGDPDSANYWSEVADELERLGKEVSPEPEEPIVSPHVPTPAPSSGYPAGQEGLIQDLFHSDVEYFKK